MDILVFCLVFVVVDRVSVAQAGLNLLVANDDLERMLGSQAQFHLCC